MRFFPGFIFTALSIVFAFFCSCTADNYKVKIEKYADRSFYREEVPDPTYLKGESVQMGDYLGRCINFLLIEDQYIVYNGLVDDYHGHLYDLSKKKLHHFGRVGKGPGELLGIYTLDYHSKDKILWAEDISQSVMIGFELDSILSSPSAAASSAVKFAPEIENMIGLQWTSPDTVIGFSHFEESGRIVVFDSSGKVLGFKGKLPPKETEDLPYFIR
jgi:hypothetical protein